MAPPRGGGDFKSIKWYILNLVPQDILVTAPKLQEEGGRLGFQLLFIPQLGATTILVTAPKLQEDGMELIFYIARRDPGDLTSISLFLSSKITKPDATRCHGTRN